MYTPLNVPNEPWNNIFMDVVLGLGHTKKGKDSILVVADIFSKMAHFIACNKTDNDMLLTYFFREVLRLHGISRIIVNVKFLSQLLESIVGQMGYQIVVFNYMSSSDGWTN